MDRDDIALTVIVFSLIAGVFMTPSVSFSETWQNLQEDLDKLENHKQMQKIPEIPGLELGSAHQHAQFFVNINGTEYRFTSEKFQLQSYYVHMENQKPHIIHKHSENVTWSFFLKTMNFNITQRESQDCIDFPGTRSCGNLSVILNGEEIQNLNREIQQGANLALMMPPSRNISEEYMAENLPRDYTPEDGTRI